MTKLIIHNHFPARRTKDDARVPFPNETPELRQKILAIKAKLNKDPNNEKLADELSRLQHEAMKGTKDAVPTVAQVKQAGGTIREKEGAWHVVRSTSGERVTFVPSSKDGYKVNRRSGGVELLENDAYSPSKWFVRMSGGQINEFKSEAAAREAFQKEVGSRSQDRRTKDRKRMVV